jgi:hypothetical protein
MASGAAGSGQIDRPLAKGNLYFFIAQFARKCQLLDAVPG